MTEKTPAPATKTPARAPAAKIISPAPATKAVAPAASRKTTVAPKIRSTASAAPTAMSAPKPSGVTITAKIDVGFGNSLFLRGSGAGLTWSKGVPLVCVANDAWSLVLSGATGPFAFKFLLNDTAWSTGKDFLAGPGDTVTVTPVF